MITETHGHSEIKLLKPIINKTLSAEIYSLLSSYMCRHQTEPYKYMILGWWWGEGEKQQNQEIRSDV